MENRNDELTVGNTVMTVKEQTESSTCKAERYIYFVSYQFQSDDGIKSGYGNDRIDMNQELETFEHVDWITDKINEKLSDSGLKDPNAVLINWKRIKK